jgi:hypothetical protein
MKKNKGSLIKLDNRFFQNLPTHPDAISYGDEFNDKNCPITITRTKAMRGGYYPNDGHTLHNGNQTFLPNSHVLFENWYSLIRAYEKQKEDFHKLGYNIVVDLNDHDMLADGHVGIYLNGKYQMGVFIPFNKQTHDALFNFVNA